MAKDPSKTEKPTAKRITEAREDGNVLNSPDITSVVLLIGVAIILSVSVRGFAAAYYESLTRVLDFYTRREVWTLETLQEGVNFSGVLFIRVLGPVMLGICLLAIVSMRAQIGSYFSFKPLEWKPEKLNPVGGWKGILPNMKNVVKLLLALAKVTVVFYFVYQMLTENIAGMVALSTLTLMEGLKWIAAKVGYLVTKIFMFFVVIAVLDFIYKAYDYYENLKMSKQEVKDEQKNAEGDPRVKGKIRQKMMEMSMMRMASEIPDADVVVTNPTHVAIALRYTPGSPAPRVVAKGLRKRAQKIKEIAAMHGIPTVEAPPLARSLYRNTKLGAFIPEHLFSAVAVVLAKIHARKRRQAAPVENNVKYAKA